MESAINIYKNYDLDQMAAYESLSTTTGSYSYDELTVAKKLLSELVLEKCQLQHVSSAVIIISNNILLISLVLLFVLLFL